MESWTRVLRSVDVYGRRHHSHTHWHCDGVGVTGSCQDSIRLPFFILFTYMGVFPDWMVSAFLTKKEGRAAFLQLGIASVHFIPALRRRQWLVFSRPAIRVYV